MVRDLANAGVRISAYDPLVSQVQARDLFGIQPSGTLEDAVRGANCVAVLALHREFEGIDFEKLPVAESCLVFDGRAYYSKQTIARLRELGYRYRGIGR